MSAIGRVLDNGVTTSASSAGGPIDLFALRPILFGKNPKLV